MSWKEDVLNIPDCTFLEDTDLTSYTTMRLSSRGDLVEVRSLESLRKLLPTLSRSQKEYLVIGWGANQILPPACSAVLIHLDLPFDPTYLDQVKTEYELPASVGLNTLTAHAVRHGLSGWEVFTGIPASLGGAIYMNAGTNLGEIGSLIKSVQVVNAKGELREEMIGPGSFSYRKNHFVRSGDVIVGAKIFHRGIDQSISQKIKDYLEYRKRTQPLATKNCGCVFKNPHRELQAGRLIDLIGLKGFTMGGLRISPKHANFIENSGGSNWDQFEALVKVVQSHMDDFYGIEFELEVKIPYH
jgi:UDP-N-acetylmuramate dehydrogenase